jgi:GntR family transcriptional repressor for pyruvate dehydrogenase complex
VEPPSAAAVAADLARRSNPLEVLEARLGLEPALARLAALRASADEVARMRALSQRLASADDADGRELWDGALHRAVARSAGNALLLAAFETIDEVRRDPAWQATRERARSAATAALYIQQHASIVDAIAARDPAAAEAAMREHLAALARSLSAQIATEASVAV